ncbi:hypothetical protein BG004_007177 [Podila humilis]|nr:hypothetical protein BG004_007177 [Podila humilis]
MDREIEVYIEFPRKDRHGIMSGHSKQKNVMTGRVGTIYGSETLKQMLTGKERQLQQKMEEAMDMDSFLVEFVDMLEEIISTNTRNSQDKPVSYWSHIVEQLDSIGWDRISSLEKDMSKIQINLSDLAGKKHVLTVCFPPGYPTVPLTIEPLVVPQYDSSNTSAGTLDQGSAFDGHIQSLINPDGLREAVERAEKQLALFQGFWEVMKDFDERTWVIDPEHPTPSDKTRRIALGKHCSVQVTINPMIPRNLPETRFFGPPGMIEPLRTNMQRNSSLWDKTKFPRENLEIILELPEGKFPSPTTATKEAMQIECGICYTFRYDGQVPDQICGHEKCQRPYHRMCLYEWLRSLPTTRQSFHTLFGQCPYCSEVSSITREFPPFLRNMRP